MESSGMTWAGVTTALGNVWDVVDSCIDFIVNNPPLLMLFAASLIPVGFKIFKKAKRSVK